MTKKHTDKYQVPSNEGYQPGSNEVLENYLNITSKSEMDIIEEQELIRVNRELEEFISKDYQFKSEDICAIHEDWLGDIYPFAGQYRTVNMSKGGFPFAAANCIEKLMYDFEREYLGKFTPCNNKNIDRIAEALAVVHVEFILIHPFREGNGRVGRMLASLMANQADLPPLNFTPIDQTVNQVGYNDYITAVQEGVSCEYYRMIEIFKEIIRVSQK